MRLVILSALALLAAGCVQPGAEVDASADAPVETATTTLPEPVVHEWSGFIVASEIETPTHMRPTEDVLWPVFQEGILFSIDELPQAMEVTLSWDGPGELMIMLHSHKAHGTNAYVEHISELDDVNPKCIRVPTEDLTEGVWQVMVHSNDARQTTFTLGVALTGGAGHVVEDDRHGHWLQDGGFDIEEHEVLPCADPAEPAE